MASERRTLRAIDEEFRLIVETKIIDGSKWKGGSGAPKNIFGWRSWARYAGFIGDDYITARVKQNTALAHARAWHLVRCWLDFDPDMAITVNVSEGTTDFRTVEDQLARAAQVRRIPTPPPYNPFPGWDEPEGWPQWSQEWMRENVDNRDDRRTPPPDTNPKTW